MRKFLFKLQCKEEIEMSFDFVEDFFMHFTNVKLYAKIILIK